jgi:hypothetical protein
MPPSPPQPAGSAADDDANVRSASREAAVELLADDDVPSFSRCCRRLVEGLAGRGGMLEVACGEVGRAGEADSPLALTA